LRRLHLHVVHVFDELGRNLLRRGERTERDKQARGERQHDGVRRAERYARPDARIAGGEVHRQGRGAILSSPVDLAGHIGHHEASAHPHSLNARSFPLCHFSLRV
jgi:hypothetical protein